MNKFIFQFLSAFLCLFASFAKIYGDEPDAEQQRSQFNKNSIDSSDMQLIDCSLEKLKKIATPEKHFVVAAIRTKSGAIYTGINLKTTATRASVCAESVALAKCIESSEDGVDTLVIVAYLTAIDGTQQPVFVTPCGICRELLLDYAPEIKIIYLEREAFHKVAIRDLLPLPYKR